VGDDKVSGVVKEYCHTLSLYVFRRGTLAVSKLNSTLHFLSLVKKE
jgi:hypothetical protein